jgi:hypothetical protein
MKIVVILPSVFAQCDVAEHQREEADPSCQDNDIHFHNSCVAIAAFPIEREASAGATGGFCSRREYARQGSGRHEYMQESDKGSRWLWLERNGNFIINSGRAADTHISPWRRHKRGGLNGRGG